jgi:hypothetical protein
MNGWLEDGERSLAEPRWPIAASHRLPLERWVWWEQLWADVVMLWRRYRLVPAAWVARYDCGNGDDP